MKSGTETWVNIPSLSLPYFNNLDSNNIKLILSKESINNSRLTFTLFPSHRTTVFILFYYFLVRVGWWICLVHQLHQTRCTFSTWVSMWATGMLCNLNMWNIAGESLISDFSHRAVFLLMLLPRFITAPLNISGTFIPFFLNHCHCLVTRISWNSKLMSLFKDGL